MKVELVSISKGVGRFEQFTTEELISVLARVSNPSNEDNVETAPKLLSYLMRQKHWSPFEMVNVCVYIECTREVSRQILRHRSFSFQEFSGRYAEYGEGGYILSEARQQDPKNRQNSTPVTDLQLSKLWEQTQSMVWDVAFKAYQVALKAGIAKELARKILPEGLTTSRLYVTGSLRSWIHYWDVRCDVATQKEHRDVAEATREAVLEYFPEVRKALK